MLRVRLFPALGAILAAAATLAGSAEAQGIATGGQVGTMPFPGGLQAALAAIDDPNPPDRAQALVEIIRRMHAGPSGAADGDAALFSRLLAHLRAASTTTAESGEAPPSTVPLPLAPEFWIQIVFDGKSSPATLAADILASRSASLFYVGLLSLDDETRAWMAEQRGLVRAIVRRTPGTFLIAASAFRVSGGVARMPGGEPASRAWETLVGRPLADPAAFLDALLTRAEGRLAYFAACLAQLTDAQLRFVLNRGEAPADDVEQVRRLYRVFERIAAGWRIEERPFWRPARDPALLVADLRADGTGRPTLPGTRAFWSAVLAEQESSRTREDDVRKSADGDPVEFVWIAEQVFEESQILLQRPYSVVLLASRWLDSITSDNVPEAYGALRAAWEYPILGAVLERVDLRDLALLAALGSRAASIAAIDDTSRMDRALAQFQGALFLLSRAARAGSLSGNDLASAVRSLAAIELSSDGEYEGRLAVWLASVLEAHASGPPVEHAIFGEAVGPMDLQALRFIAGPRPTAPVTVDWEGTRYRVDWSWAEETRMAQLLGQDAPPFLSAAREIVTIADALSGDITRDALQAQRQRLDAVAQSGRWAKDISELFQRLSRGLDSRNPRRTVQGLRSFADDLLGRGLLTLAYAASLGQPDRTTISAGEAASRHDFATREIAGPRRNTWHLPMTGSDRLRDWRVTGSIAGLDATLADRTLRRLSSKLPPRRPTLNESDRRTFIETVALIVPRRFTAETHERLLALIRRGRERVNALRTVDDAATLAGAIGMSPLRRTLLAWTVSNDSKQAGRFFALGELLVLGLEGQPLDPALHAWGVSAKARTGCLCVQVAPPVAADVLLGRWDTGIAGTGFVDLSLRLAEILGEMQMPALLLPGVLTSATLEFVNKAASRDRDDRRALVEYVRRLGIEDLEMYLALLTTDGPLVPLQNGQ